MLYNVTVIKTATVKEQEAGGCDQIIVPMTQVIACNISAAALIVGANNAKTVADLGDQACNLAVAATAVEYD
jgi:hypothetical protein